MHDNTAAKKDTSNGSSGGRGGRGSRGISGGGSIISGVISNLGVMQDSVAAVVSAVVAGVTLVVTLVVTVIFLSLRG